MYIQIKSKLCTTSVITVVSVKEKDFNEVEIKFKDKEALKLSRVTLTILGLNLYERAFIRMIIK